jgi:protein-tyrosine phosphatase
MILIKQMNNNDSKENVYSTIQTNFSLRELYKSLYNWRSISCILGPHLLLLGGVDPPSEDPYDTVVENGYPRPTLIISIDDDEKIDLLSHFKIIWPQSVSWIAIKMYDIPDLQVAEEYGYKMITIANLINYHIREHRDPCIFVHCRMGISRSATLVIYYLMRYHNMSLFEATKFVRERRPCICPNVAFSYELFKLEKVFQSEKSYKKEVDEKSLSR